jgi:hypothetical protein
MLFYQGEGVPCPCPGIQDPLGRFNAVTAIDGLFTVETLKEHAR